MPALHFILADYGRLGTAWVERDPNEMDRKTTVRDIASLQIDRPLRIIEVDIEEGTCRDVSEDIAREIAGAHEPLHPNLIEFIERHAGTLLANELVEDAA